MLALTIPREHLRGLKALLSMPGEVLPALIRELEEIPLSFAPHAKVKAAFSQIGGVPSQEADYAARVLMSLLILRDDIDEDISELVGEIANQLRNAISDEPLEKETLDTIEDRLGSFLNINSLLVSAKAVSVMSEQDKLFDKSRVLTDIRPVFGTQVDEAPKAALIVHNLAIHFYQHGEHQEFFMAMSENELQKLIDALERAKSKAKSLKAVMVKANLEILEEEPLA
jgi:hypothetical protein